MTDSMKFGPEWLRNMSNDMGTGGTSSTSNNNSTTAPLGPRYQLAEYRYGREEMLSLFDKNLKAPEILPTFKTLYVDKLQCPLALTPSTEDEVANSTRPWALRSPVNFAVPTRGTGRGGSVDRGRGRTPRGAFHTLIGYQRPTALYDEDIRGLGRGERGWPERNGGNEIGGGTADWNGSPSSSPRKEYNTHVRVGNLENWRRGRTDDDSSAGDGWRGGSSTTTSGSTYRWSRSTSWRDEDPSNAGSGGNGDQVPSQITRSFSTSGGSSALDRIATSNNSTAAFKTNSNSQSNQNESSNNKSNATSVGGGGGGGGNSQWEQDDMLPEWAMENPTDGGGSFDASGAFHGSNEGNDDDTSNKGKNEKESIKKVSNSSTDSSIKSKEETHITNDIENKNSEKCIENAANKELPDEKTIKENEIQIEKPEIKQLQTVPKPTEEKSLEDNNDSKNSNVNSIDQQQHNQKPQQSSSSGNGSAVSNSNTSNSNSTSLSKPIPPPISEISDRMQEVADDMVEKLIMDDEITTTKTTTTTKKSSTTNAPNVSILKNNAVTSNTSTAQSLLQQPLINSHPLIPQPQPPSSTELWYYRDPQGKVQGPFTAAEMAEWYRAGYFDENLFVRRVCDSRFAALGELVKMCGNSMPFLSSHLIPPLVDMAVPTVPHIPQTNQPTPQQQVAMNSKTNVNPMLGTNDMMSLNIQLQFLQKQFLMRQQSMILNKLAASEPWSLLNPEQQQQLLNQQMSQVVLPDHLMSLSALSNSLSIVNPSTFALQQMLTAAKNEMNQAKSTQALHNPLGTFSDFSAQASLHNLMQNNVAPPPPPPNIGQQPPNPHSAGTPGLENDPIKSLLMQLHIQNKITGATPVPPPVANKWPGNMAPQQSWPGGSTATGSTPVSMWDFGPIPTKSEMKTEQQIIQDQLQKEKLSRQAEIGSNATASDRIDIIAENVIQHQQQQQQQQQQHQHQQQQQQHQTHSIHQSNLQAVNSGHQQQQQQQQQQLQQQQQHQLLQQQQQHLNKRENEKSKISFDEKVQKSMKHEDEQKKNKGGKTDKKDNKKIILSEEERKREAAEEKKRQKEEKKRQQIEEEKKRQQQQEEEERRQLLEEKKRQEEIDQHRRAKMLENAGPKSSTNITKKSSFERAISSSVAPWINTGLPGITTPGPNLAEIQKAERERRAEEQRLEQIMEHQRKSQMELLASQKENVLKWNSQPLKSLNVKSLAEIQAEEAKRLASDQAAAASLEQRKKEEASVNQTLPYGNNAFASVWNSRSSQNIAWNGKTAWGTTSTSGFWEEPTKISSTISLTSSSSTSSKQQPTNPRMLSKSQTISNIQSVKKDVNNKAINIQNNNNNINSNATAGGNIATITSATSATTAGGGGGGGGGAAITTAAAATKQGKGKNKKDSLGSSSSNSGQNNSNVKKDDARNEFTSWCIKTLSSMNSSVDGIYKYFDFNELNSN